MGDVLVWLFERTDQNWHIEEKTFRFCSKSAWLQKTTNSFYEGDILLTTMFEEDIEIQVRGPS